MLSAAFNSYLSIATLTVAILWGQGVQAQIVSDDTANTKVQTNDGISQITGGIQLGENLFHSFDKFSVITEGAANFDNTLEIEHIFSRVTGGTVSEIDGLIQTQGNADLFLLNPTGIIFGANAQLDLGGSFIASTGERIIFADGTEFSAIEPETDPLLTVSAPVGLQYGSEGEIEVLPSNNRADPNLGLSIYPGNTLALLGGNVSVSQNSLNTVGSNTEIASVKSGTVNLKLDELGWQFGYAGNQFGEIDFSNGALVRSNGQTHFQGKTINFAANSGILNFSQANETNSQIDLTATESISIDRGLLTTQVGQISESIEEAITNAGGNIIIDAPQIDVSNGSFITAGTLSDGDGGNITINADRLRLFSQEGQNPAIITTSTGGGGIGRGGAININTDMLQIENGSQIQALAGVGSGGTITVNATDEIYLSGTGILRSQDIDKNRSKSKLASGFSASSGNESIPVEERAQFTGAGGNLIINTPKLTIDESAQISVGSYGPAKAGNIEIHTSNLNLNTAGQIIANTASNEGGSINVWAKRSIILDRHSSISTTADSSGNGGNITLVAENLALLNSNRISADAKVGNGGNIYIDTTGLFIDSTSSITASSRVKQNDGTVEISTLDLNSRLANYIEPSSLNAEDDVIYSCGVGNGSQSNKIRNVGRGGIPNNPFREAANIEVLSDLGINKLDWTNISNSTKVNRSMSVSKVQPIVEVGGWLINSQGRVELVANASSQIPIVPCLSDRS